MYLLRDVDAGDQVWGGLVFIKPNSRKGQCLFEPSQYKQQNTHIDFTLYLSVSIQ